MKKTLIYAEHGLEIVPIMYHSPPSLTRDWGVILFAVVFTILAVSLGYVMCFSSH